MFQNGELICATECLSLQARCLINRCCYNRVRLYYSRWLCGRIVTAVRWWAKQVTDKITVVWDVTPHIVAHWCQVSSETSIPIYCGTLAPGFLRNVVTHILWHVGAKFPPKRRYPYTVTWVPSFLRNVDTHTLWHMGAKFPPKRRYPYTVAHWCQDSSEISLPIYHGTLVPSVLRNVDTHYCGTWVSSLLRERCYSYTAKQITDKITAVWDVTPYIVTHWCQVSYETSIPITVAHWRQVSSETSISIYCSIWVPSFLRNVDTHIL